MKSESLKAVPPDGQYGITYGSGGHIIVAHIEFGETIMFLPDNYAAWLDQAMGVRNIAEYIHYRFCYENYFQYRRG